MENIKIQNFLVIKKADINIKKLNIIIGPQANGKSIVAKLLYFFKNTSIIFINSIQSQSDKRTLDRELLSDFEKKFPRYAWEGTNFTITYQINDLKILINGTKNARGKTNISISYSEELTKLFSTKKKLYLKKIEELTSSEKFSATRQINNLERHVFYEHIVDPLRHGEYSEFFSNSIFIPASRSFFANLQKNIFTFLASNIDIDPFLKEFGSVYQNCKRWYKDAYLMKEHRILLTDLYKALDSIVGGDYEFHEDQDWIVNKSRKINLVNASSGQQESLPMLLVLCVWPMLRLNQKENMLFIEEPEAHLFPTSQSHVVSILSLLYSSLKTNFFITSHSPYILSAINNFILAHDAIDNNRITIEQFQEINGLGMPISFDDISAYTINNGISSDIADSEYRMIGADMLDGISEHFEKVMNHILSCSDEK
jgi:predicted ATPase